MTRESVATLTAAQSAQVEQPHSWDAATPEQTKSLERWLCLTRWVSTAIVCLVLVVLPLSALTVLHPESHKRTCGVDWILWLVGSDQTFEGTMLQEIEKASRESKFRMDETEPAIRPLEFNLEGFNKGFNLSEGILYKPEE